ncbi:TPR-like protein [Meredithblackwellia eburnea MCA 4105]
MQRRAISRLVNTWLRQSAVAAVRPAPTRSFRLGPSASKVTPLQTRPSSIATYATSTTATSSSFDPQTVAAQQALDEGTIALSNGDLQTAEDAYKKSIDIRETAIAFYNLGVVQYQKQDLVAAITSFEKSLALSPAEPPTLANPETDELPPLTAAQLVLADTHTNLGAAYIMSQPPRPDKALEHLQKALEINPDDAELVYNLAAVLEATEDLDEALVAYQRAEQLGIERATVNIRNIGAKILGKRLKEEKEEDEAAKAAKVASSADVKA